MYLPSGSGTAVGSGVGLGSGVRLASGVGVTVGAGVIVGVGAAVGVGVCAVGYYAYKKNQNQVDNFLRQQGINVSSTSHKDYKNMSLEDLMETKELIEDLIAEKEIHDEAPIQEATNIAE